jgi:hypothetical protein
MKIVDEQKLINLTGHVIVLISNGEEITIPSDGLLLVTKNVRRESNDIGFNRFRYKEILEIPNLPPKAENTLYIVSSVTRMACSHREDFISPTLSVKSSTFNNVRACRGFAVN